MTDAVNLDFQWALILSSLWKGKNYIATGQEEKSSSDVTG